MREREKALELLEKHLKTEHLTKHSYAVEAVMRALAKRLEPSQEEQWAMAGLLHDLDADLVDYKNGENHLHGPKTVEILKEAGIGDESMYHAICAHNKETGVKIESTMDRAIYAADPITGFITAITLVYPDKKLSSVKVKSISKRMKELKFAAGADRQAMASIEKIGIPFSEFAELSLKAMQEISDDLGL
ncbi:Predicted hydrolase, HD superfamily [Natronincola peptidivorans]|uniref:Predicted hydrolase, HD superfamily n=1 Tax=Natronincola peptidivorans TaxID=426128 RepID=A0A1I0BRH6_9FIRM|nr:HD domain-containing protein [Natronincola peptidivorans]SET09678.1 Predicted hydrolase, HD superfamily [Natronincola peptidivorans]